MLVKLTEQRVMSYRAKVYFLSVCTADPPSLVNFKKLSNEVLEVFGEVVGDHEIVLNDVLIDKEI